MDKKEIYDHLAKIYLDASSKSKSKKKSKKPSVVNKSWLAIVPLAGVAGAAIFSSLNLGVIKQKTSAQSLGSLRSETELVLQNDAAKINFNFNPAKKEIYRIHLNKTDISRFRALGFSARKEIGTGDLSLRVEVESSFGERSEVYYRGIPYRWKAYSVAFSDFKNIGRWNNIAAISFIVEEWNAEAKRGVVYIDNVRLIQ